MTREDSLAEVVVVAAAITLPEEDSHTFGHINTKKTVPVSNHSSQRCKRDRFYDGIICEMFPPESGPLHVELYHKSSI